MANDRVIQVVINEEEQHLLWKEVGEWDKEIKWGIEWWDFAKEAGDEFLLIRKVDLKESG